MRLFTAIVLIAACAVLAYSQPNDEAGVRALIQQYVEARDNRDANATRSLFLDDADQLVSTGEWRHGQAELVKGTMASSAQNEGKRTITINNVRFLTPGVAIADGPYEIGATATAPARKMWTTFVLQRKDSGWKIAAIRNMLPTGPPNR